MNFIKTASLISLLFCFLSSDAQGQSKSSILKSAKIIFIDARSGFMNAQAFERELMKLPEFNFWELSLVRKNKRRI